jgi:hypothetical protein
MDHHLPMTIIFRHFPNKYFFLSLNFGLNTYTNKPTPTLPGFYKELPYDASSELKY